MWFDRPDPLLPRSELWFKCRIDRAAKSGDFGYHEPGPEEAVDYPCFAGVTRGRGRTSAHAAARET